jgi:hypothetical protein
MVPKEGGYGFVQEPVAKVGLLEVQVLQDFVFWDNTTNAPIPLPVLEQDWNLIPSGTRVFGLVLCGVTMVMSVVW